MTTPYRIDVLGQHERSAFCCGVEALDNYLHRQATQDVRRRVANCFVLLESSTNAIVAYYTLSMASLVMTELPQQLAKRLPRYPSLPAARIGRLAVDQRFRGRGLGGAVLADVAERILGSPAAAYALIVDAKDEAAVRFYEHHGFARFASLLMSLFLPVETARRAKHCADVH